MSNKTPAHDSYSIRVQGPKDGNSLVSSFFMRSGRLVGIGGKGGYAKKMAFEGWPSQANEGKMTTGQALTAVKRMNVTMMSMTVMPFTLVTRRPYCPGRPKELCFTTPSLAMETMGMRLSVVRQCFFGPLGQIWPPCDKGELGAHPVLSGGTGNRQRESGNKCTAATLLRVQNGGQDKRKGSKRNNLG